MPDVDFLITNPNHHVEAALPVARVLMATPRKYRCRVLSLCEFRGFRTPVERFASEGVLVERVIPFEFRSPSSSVPGEHRGQAAWLPQLLREAAWQILAFRLRHLWRYQKPDVVVLANDSAYPNDRICRLLHAYAIPFVLLQEGIRFPLPGVDQVEAYGRGGAAAIAAWGAASAAYFVEQGVPEQAIHLTGSPRFDSIHATDWQSEALALKQQLGLQRPVLLVLSNPIDDQGYCSTEEKLNLIAILLDAAIPALETHDLDLVIKLHPRESIAQFQAIANEAVGRERIHVMQQVSLYPLFALAKAAVILASTTGLEALLCGVPIGVLEIPGTGFVYDYVSSKAASGLCVDARLSEQLGDLVAHAAHQEHAQRYLAHNFSKLGQSATAVAEVIEQVI